MLIVMILALIITVQKDNFLIHINDLKKDTTHYFKELLIWSQRIHRLTAFTLFRCAIHLKKEEKSVFIQYILHCNDQ